MNYMLSDGSWCVIGTLFNTGLLSDAYDLTTANPGSAREPLEWSLVLHQLKQKASNVLSIADVM